MAGTVVVTEERATLPHKVKFAWTSDASGNADGQTTHPYSGEVVRLVTIPDAVAAPTDNYDVAVEDEDETDVLMAAGTDRATSTTEQVLASSLGCVANDRLNLQVTNAGNAKSGVTILYIR